MESFVLVTGLDDDVQLALLALTSYNQWRLLSPI